MAELFERATSGETAVEISQSLNAPVRTVREISRRIRKDGCLTKIDYRVCGVCARVFVLRQGSSRLTCRGQCARRRVLQTAIKNRRNACPQCGREKWKEARLCPDCRSGPPANIQARKEWVRWLASGGGGEEIPDEFGLLLFRWMATEGHTVRSAALALELSESLFRVYACHWVRRWQITEAGILRLAVRLGRADALGWSGERWQEEMLRRQPTQQPRASPRIPSAKRQCAETGCDTGISAAATYCGRHKSPHRVFKEKPCETCGRWYTPASGAQRMCSPGCLGGRAPVKQSQGCFCGCGGMTSGRPYQSHGRWHYPRFIKGHYLRVRTHRGKKSSTRSLYGVGGRDFVAEVRERLEGRGLTFEWLKKQTGVRPGTLFSMSRPRRATIAKVAAALDMDMGECMLKAGWPKPDAVAVGIMKMLGTGLTRARVAGRLGVGVGFVNASLRGKRHFTNPGTGIIDAIAETLGLSDADVEAEHKRAYELHSADMRRALADLSPEVRAARRDRLLAWMEREPEKARARRKSIISFPKLAAILDDLGSYKAVANALGVSDTTVSNWARKAGLESQRATAIRRSAAHKRRGQILATGHKVAAADRRMMQYWPVFEHWEAKGMNIKAKNVWRHVVKDAGGTVPTADKAYKEWLSSRSGKE
jgi:transcriptional regulator with XRE-family HTH domain